MPGILWSQHQRLAAAVQALHTWTESAAALNIRVPSITVELLDEETGSALSAVVFEFDVEADEYVMRTL